MTSNSEYSYALQVSGNPNAENYASQTVIINQPSAQTYVLSGWGKANAVPDNVTASNLKNVEYGTARDKNKQFGLRAILTYSDGATEYHYTPFSADISTWQFTSMTIVPRRSDKTVQKIQVVCAYERNANVAYFDDLSLVKEPAQIMKYDDDGNLISVTTTGLKGEGSKYKNGNLIKSVTSGYGTFTYKYEDSAHPHSATSVSNGVVTQKNEYDTVGNATTTTLSGSSGPYLKTSVSYTNNGNLLASVTDASGQTVSYQYGNNQSVMTGLPTKVLDAKDNATTISYTKLNQLLQKGFANGGKIQYNYGNGALTGVTRTGAGKTQSLTLGRDSFGNQTSVRVGDILLSSYEYGAGNGLLQKQTYGNNASVSYTYDKLGRILKASYSSGRSLRYTYTGDGQVYSITDDNGTSATTDDLVCYYTYDSLGRVVDSRMCRGIQTLLQSHLTYDDSSRISTQAWQMGSQSYKESYTYNETDGTLEKISSSGGGNSLSLEYDELERLNQVNNGVYEKTYSYLDVIKNVQTSMQVGKIQYSGLLGALSGLNYKYTYDDLGNIATVTPSVGDAESYTYDAMGQLTEATLGGTEYVYTYDGAGNITRAQRGTTANSYTYGNSSWADLLTAFNGQAIAYEGQTVAADGTVTGTPVSGNPISYYNGSRWSFAWSEGRNLTSAVSTDEDGTLNANAQYAYDAGGLRIEKTVAVKEYEWVTEHDYEEEGWFEPTCTEKGYYLFTCQVCGDSYQEYTDEALGHDYQKIDIDTYYCSRCEQIEIIHDYSILMDAAEPTCEEAGYQVWACECGQETTKIIRKLGHDYKVIRQTERYTTQQCTRCGLITTFDNEQAVLPTAPPPDFTEQDMEVPENPVAAQSQEEEPADRGPCTTRQYVGEITEKHSYIYASGKLLRETITGNGATKILDFRYDQSGAPYSLTYTVGSTSTVYYYVTNLQGDVMFLVDGKGNQVAAYTYDPYGKVLSATGTMAEINPLRYRGYYQDSETGFYYLQSRYYDPTICRFINADSYASTGQGLLDYNMFAYCKDNPVNQMDPTGEFGFWGAVLGAVVGAVCGVISSAVTGGDAKDILISAISGAVAGGIIGGFGNTVLARAAASAVTAVGTYVDCVVYHEVPIKDGLLCAGASAAITYATASLSSLVGKDIFASTFVDCTFGLGGSLVSSGISAGVTSNKGASTSLRNDPSTASKRAGTARRIYPHKFQVIAFG